jgi:RNA polymerase sigma-70 factor (ECF subfamily)
MILPCQRDVHSFRLITGERRNGSDLSRPQEGAARTAELVDRARRGDELAFRHLVERHRDQVFRQALVQTGDVDDAEDVTQEVLVRLHLGLPGFRGAAKFETWLFTLTRNAAIELRRSRKRPRRLVARMREYGATGDGVTEDPTRRLEARRIGEELRALLEDLSERQRTVLDLVDLQGYPAGEVAEMLGMRPVTVRTHLMRARRVLRKRYLERDVRQGELDVGL